MLQPRIDPGKAQGLYLAFLIWTGYLVTLVAGGAFVEVHDSSRFLHGESRLARCQANLPAPAGQR